MMTDRAPRVLGAKPAPMPLCPTQVPYGLPETEAELRREQCTILRERL